MQRLPLPFPCIHCGVGASKPCLNLPTPHGKQTWQLESYHHHGLPLCVRAATACSRGENASAELPKRALSTLGGNLWRVHLLRQELQRSKDWVPGKNQIPKMVGVYMIATFYEPQRLVVGVVVVGVGA